MKSKATPPILMTILSMLLHAGCLSDAEHENPLDPRSKNFTNTGGIQGQVFSFYAPFQPLSGAEVRVAAASALATTNVSGLFEINNLPAGQYEVVAAKVGYAADTSTVTVEAGEFANQEFHLDGLPVVSVFSLISCHISRWFPTDDLFLLEIDATITDPDGAGDISLVEVEIPDLDYVNSLASGQAPGTFELTIRDRDLPGQNLQNLVGRNIYLRVRDRAGAVIRSQPERLARIISVLPAPNSPVGLADVSESRPTLQWRSAGSPFSFSYRVNLFRDDSGISTDIWQKPNIASADTATVVEPALTTGNYFWTISIVDEFGNWSRSKEAAFVIRQN